MTGAGDVSTWTVRALEAADHDRWRELYAGYAAFYAIDQTDEQAERVWGWLMQGAHAVEGLAAVDPRGRLGGLAHFRTFARPSSATLGGYLDDLFVDPALRGTGAAEALLGRLQVIAHERGWSLVRWITADDNYRARARYDRMAARTPWVTYDMQPRPEA